MPKPLIAITDSVFPSLDPAKKALARLDPEYRMAKSAAADDILAVARDADAILVTYAKLPGELLRQLTRCKAIGRFGLGVDNIDLPAAKERGIAVNYVPDYCLREVSDHAMALLLALARKVTFSNKLVQSGRWEVPPIVPLRRLEGQVLGLVGFGNIPRTLAPKAKAFGLKVITYDPYVVTEALAATGVESVSFDDLLARSDFISVHAPLQPATRGLMNAKTFAKMKKGAFLINTARGPLVDEPALIAALNSGHLGGAALDVVTTEPLAKDSALDRPRQRDPDPTHRVLFGRSAGGIADEMCERRRARAQRRKSDLSDLGLGAASVAQRLALDGAAAHQPRLLARKILARMDRAPIVPDHEIAEPPFVLVDDRRVFGDIEQLRQRRLAFIGRKAFDARRHQPADIERLLAGRRMGDDDRLLVVQDLFQRHLRQVDALAAFVVVHLQHVAAFEPVAQRARNVVVSLVHVGEAGLAAPRGELHRIQKRRAMRLRVIAGVVMEPHLAVAEGADRFPFSTMLVTIMNGVS